MLTSSLLYHFAKWTRRCLLPKELFIPLLFLLGHNIDKLCGATLSYNLIHIKNLNQFHTWRSEREKIFGLGSLLSTGNNLGEYRRLCWDRKRGISASFREKNCNAVTTVPFADLKALINHHFYCRRYRTEGKKKDAAYLMLKKEVCCTDQPEYDGSLWMCHLEVKPCYSPCDMN